MVLGKSRYKGIGPRRMTSDQIHVATALVNIPASTWSVDARAVPPLKQSM